LGTVPVRAGNTLPASLVEGVTGGMARSKDGVWMAYSAATDSVVVRLVRLVFGEEGFSNPLYATAEDRRVHHGELQQSVNDWVSQRSGADVEAAFEAAEAVIAPVYDVAMMMSDPTFAARGNIISVEDPDFGDLAMPAPSPLVMGAPGEVRWTGPRLGEHTAEVLTSVAGLNSDDVEALQKEGIV
jgi:crotonobetainyl-CoA:carnitine CoA-transferase CaiB-like acyl-CoA transferase